AYLAGLSAAAAGFVHPAVIHGLQIFVGHAHRFDAEANPQENTQARRHNAGNPIPKHRPSSVRRTKSLAAPWPEIIVVIEVVMIVIRIGARKTNGLVRSGRSARLLANAFVAHLIEFVVGLLANSFRRLCAAFRWRRLGYEYRLTFRA